MQPDAPQQTCNVLNLEDLFNPDIGVEVRSPLVPCHSQRRWHRLADGSSRILDRFPDAGDATCCFLRSASPTPAPDVLRLAVAGSNAIESCPLGGWLLVPEQVDACFYWIPRTAIARSLNTTGHIISESPAPALMFGSSSAGTFVDLRRSDSSVIDLPVWRFPKAVRGFLAELRRSVPLEEQEFYLWGSRTQFRPAAGLYDYLVHGHVYVNDFIWPRNWKFCSELDAYGLFVTLRGLWLATGKPLYALLRNQVLLSVIDRQAEDGGWHHGEWTTLMESHYRLHNSAMLILESALQEQEDDIIATALARAAAFIATRSDHTDLGLWFLHDSLEDSAALMDEMFRQTGSRWIPTRSLGKSPTNKMVLNTHLDAIVALDRYREITGDSQYSQRVTSACSAARTALALRPAERLYRLLFWAIALTTRPAATAKRMSFPLRVVRYFTAKYLTRQLHRVRRMFPRFAMPGGLIERHLAPLHFNVNYHPVNVLDLARYLRRFPTNDLSSVLADAIRAVRDNDLLQYWSEHKKRQFALAVWVDAMYQLCTFTESAANRRYLAEAIIALSDAGLGIPPSLLGSDLEATGHPIPTASFFAHDGRIKVATLTTVRNIEFLIVNPTHSIVEIEVASATSYPLSWTDAAGQTLKPDSERLLVGPRQWLRVQGLDGRRASDPQPTPANRPGASPDPRLDSTDSPRDS